jgi:hypothetical protein
VAALTEQQVKALVKGQINVHAGFGVDQPYDGIVIFKPVAGYIDVELELASDFILLHVRRRFMNGLWTELAVYPSPIAWQLLEEYLLEALQGNNTYTERVCVGNLNPAYNQHQQIQLGGCNDKVLVGDCTTAVRNGADRVMYYSSSRTHPLYDMIFKIGNIYYAVQVTIGKTHDAKQRQIDTIIHDLSNKFGFIQQEINGVGISDSLAVGFAVTRRECMCPRRWCQMMQRASRVKWLTCQVTSLSGSSRMETGVAESMVG